MKLTIGKKDNQNKVLSDASLVEKYTDQSSKLPSALRKEVELFLGKTIQIQAYAYVDLNSHFQLAEAWLMITEDWLVEAVAKQGAWRYRKVAIDEIRSVEEVSGLSCERMSFVGDDDEVLLTVRYSHRQLRTMAILKHIVECRVENPEEKAELPDAHGIYQKEVLANVKEAQASVTGSQAAVIWRLLSYLKPYRNRVAFGFVGAILMTTMVLIPAYLTGYLIDHVLRPFEAGGMTREYAWEVAMWTIGGLVVIYFFRELFAWVRLRTMSVIGEYVARDLRKEVYNHLHKLSLKFFSSKQTGSLISRVGSDTDRIWDFVAFGVVEVTTSVMMLTGLAVMLIHLDWKLGLVVTLPIPFMLYAIYRHGEHMERLFLRAWRKWSNLTDCLSDTIPGIRVVKAFHRQGYEVDRFNGRNDSVTGEFNRIHRAWTTFWPGLMASKHVLFIAVWVLGVPRVLDGDLTTGVFVSFVLYLTMFTQPIEIIGQMARMVNRATSSAHRVFEVLDTEPTILEVNEPVRLDDFKGEVEFRDVKFSYDGVRNVIKGVNFKVKPGEMIGLVGPSGGGKSTTTNLIARFFDVTGGRILVDGVDVKNLDLEHFRNQLGIVLQDPYLFHGTILENIRYARPEASVEDVVAAARAANAHDFICKLPNAYDTLVGERGQSLSGGERQRVSIARAILRNPKLLILDEATSAVDTETEKKIQEALDRLVEGRTVFAIAHRLSTLVNADRIFVIKEGEIVESGTHQDLMQLEKGLYKGLVDMQNQLARV